MFLTKIPFFNENIETASLYSFIIHLDSVVAPKLINDPAKDALYKKIYGKVVELRNVSCDKHGKIYANVFIGNEFINEWLLKNDYVVSCKNNNKRRVSESDSHNYDKTKLLLPKLNVSIESILESSLSSQKKNNYLLPSIERQNTDNTLLTIQTDCFLSHNWGENHINHLKVKTINDILKQRGLKTWLDENKIDGNIRFKMAEGIDNTKCIVVFITREYRDKVNGIDMKDNCKYEFTYAMNQFGSQNMIPVIMEPEMRETNKWKGELGAALGSMLYIDFTVESEIEKKYDELYKRIRHVIHRESKKICG